MEGDVTIATRYMAVPRVGERELRAWLSEQARLLVHMNLPAEMQIYCASIIRALGGDQGHLKICQVEAQWASVEELRQFLATHAEITIVSDYTIRDLGEYSPDCRPVDGLVGVSSGRPGVFHSAGGRYEGGDFEGRWGISDSGALETTVLETVFESWELGEEFVLAYNKRVYRGKPISRTGRPVIALTHDGKEITGYGKKFWRGMQASDLM